jgi:signal-transduction protein with cAMP-binding, CBS, and nucleotidyltransferase domain
MNVKKCHLFKPILAKEDDSIVKVAKLLKDTQERRVIVVNKNKMPLGIISIVDINDRVVAKAKSLKTTKARDIMSYPLNLIVDVNEDVTDVAKKMTRRNTFYCPVTQNNKIIGMLTYSNILNAIKPKNRRK